MKERPILFSGPMARALLDGSKTQTRRICKQQPYPNGYKWDGHDFLCHNDYLPPSAMLMDCGGKSLYTTSNVEGWESECSYGQPGERLWVRETFAPNAGDEMSFARWGVDSSGPKPEIHFAADGGDPHISRWRPSIHMPRWASRILLEIASVRVERLNECSEADAKAEGVMQLDADDSQRPEERTNDGWKLCPKCEGTGLHCAMGAGGGVIFDVDCRECDTHAKLYRHLWESINGAGSWAANPWVWVIEFKRVMP